MDSTILLLVLLPLRFVSCQLEGSGTGLEKSKKIYKSMFWKRDWEKESAFKRFYVLDFILKPSLKKLDFFFPYSGSWRQ